jgi:hypothetical protein
MDQIPAELIEAGVEQLALRIIIPFIVFGMRRNCLRSGRNQSLYLFVRRAMKRIMVHIQARHFIRYVQNCIQYSAVNLNSICRGNYLGLSVWISTQLVNCDPIFSIRKILEKKWHSIESLHRLFTDLKLTIQLGGRYCIIFALSLVSPGNW